MKIGFVSPYSFCISGGVQNHILGLSQWLGSAGHQVSILGPGQPTPAVLRDHDLDPEQYTSAGPAIPVPYNGSIARINFTPSASRRVAAWLTENDFDVVHVHEPITPSVALLTLWEAEVPVVATFHTATPRSRAMSWAGRLLPGSINRIDLPIAVSAAASEVVRRHIGVDARIIGNGICLDKHPLRTVGDARWRAGDHPRLTFLGRYSEPRKGFDVLLDALPQIRDHHPDLKVTVVGEGESSTIDGVEFLGRLDDVARNELLSHTDLYVAPHTGRESFGIVLLEALASGAPVLSSDLAAFVDVLSDDAGPVGRIFPVGQSRALAEAAVASLAEPRDLQLERGRRQAKRFDWSCIGNEVLSAYDEAIVRHRRPRSTGTG